MTVTKSENSPSNDQPTGESLSTPIAFGVAVLAGMAATVGLWLDWSDTEIGLCIAACLGGIGIGLVTWAQSLPIDHETVQMREDLSLAASDRADFASEGELTAATLGRRPALRKLLGAAMAALGVAVLTPLRFLGPSPSGGRAKTSWAAGLRVVGVDGLPVKAADGREDQLSTVFPEGHTNADDSQVVLIRVPAETLTPVTIQGGAVDGWVAYSKICTHAGCSVGLFGIDTREPQVLRQLVCPCHQSVFDPTDGARPIGGPAPRPLPQLPLAIDSEGYLIATSDFDRPVGPAAWHDE